MKLSAEQVYEMVRRLLPTYLGVMGLQHWQVEVSEDGNLDASAAAHTVWDVSNHLAVMRINTCQHTWSDVRESGHFTLPQTVAHELVHLWFGEAHTYHGLEALEKAGAISEGVADAVDKILEVVVDTIASRLVYEGALSS